MTARQLPLDFLLGSSLIATAASLYAALFLHVPALTEVRDFLLRFGPNANLLHVFVPTGDDYRPFSWKLFAWQQQWFGFHSELLNLAQFLLLGLCALAAYVHLRQLIGYRTAAFGASALWLFSLPVADAAFWQATQHDKLAFLFAILTLILTLHAIRLERGARIAIYATASLGAAALAVAAKPVAFMLPAALVAQLFLLGPGKTRSEYLRAAGVIMVPAVYVALYASVYMLAMTPEWRAHTMSGDIMRNLLIYMRNVANVDYEGRVIRALLLFVPVVAVWTRAIRPMTGSAQRVLVYLSIIFIASVALLAGAAHASAYYLLLPVFAFCGTLGALAALLAAGGNGWMRRPAALAITAVVVALFANYWIAVNGRLSKLGRSGRHLSEGYKIIRDLAAPERVQSMAFYYPRKPSGYFYFFSDGAHQGIDPMIPAFVFRRPVSMRINDAWGNAPSEVPGADLVAVWSDELRLIELKLFGETIYRKRSGG